MGKLPTFPYMSKSYVLPFISPDSFYCKKNPHINSFRDVAFKKKKVRLLKWQLCCDKALISETQTFALREFPPNSPPELN